MDAAARTKPYLNPAVFVPEIMRFTLGSGWLSKVTHFPNLRVEFAQPHSKNKCVVKRVIFTHYTCCQVCNSAKCVLTTHCQLNFSGPKR